MKIRIKIDKLTIQHALDIYEIMQLVLKREHKVDQAKEHFWVLAMSSANKILSLELVALGANNRVSARPADVLAIPLQKQAAGVILVHNHPSGKLKASAQDEDFTDLMIQACRLMKTPVLDHVIITEHSYLSFKETGLLARLEASNKYVLPYELERQYHEEMEAAIRAVEQESKQKIKESLKNREQEIAKQMLSRGLDMKLICDMTGLSEGQLNELR